MISFDEKIKHRADGTSSGFTLTEILIVVAILLIIFFLALLNYRTQINKANDAKRKTDLANIQRAFEETYNDTSCYPPLSILDGCGGTSLAPYLPKLPCDPKLKKPYFYYEGTCKGYRVCAKLENLSDPDIARLGCDPVIGCGFKPGYNYCIASGLTPAATRAQIENMEAVIRGRYTPTPEPTPVTNPGNYACTKNEGKCNSYGDTSCDGGGCCPVTSSNSDCLDVNGNNFCNNRNFWCTNY